MLKRIGERVRFDPERAQTRAQQLTEQGIGPADAAHIAFSEETEADFVTCDDRLLRQGQRVQLNIWIGNPVRFCDKENL